ncbi:MAG: gamma-glutamyl-gamma-aminobutyrate hydrolase family protein, partial [Deltaproteobacteria bacterium]|nr:gamma-glutamyl-gamma-aminobutyrate hydrolase family protein [Deltaproteobacteria bacterium]
DVYKRQLIEDIPSATGSAIHQNNYFRKAHSIRILTNSHLYKAVKTRILRVNSTHHQAVYNIPSCFKISATADDGIVEAIEIDSEKFVLGVQFHPEGLIRDKRHIMLFEYFIKKAREK